MTLDQKRFLLLLRSAEWQLNDVAFAVLRGTPPAITREELADTLAALVSLLRGDQPVVISDHDRS